MATRGTCIECAALGRSISRDANSRRLFTARSLAPLGRQSRPWGFLNKRKGVQVSIKDMVDSEIAKRQRSGELPLPSDILTAPFFEDADPVNFERVSSRLSTVTRCAFVRDRTGKIHLMYQSREDLIWRLVCEKMPGPFEGKSVTEFEAGEFCVDCACDLAFAGLDTAQEL
jgi:hypothetical protein